MNVPLFFSILFILGLVSLYFGRRAGEHVEGKEAYFLSNRNIKYVALTITILATQLGGGTLIGISDEAYQKGWIALLYPLGVYLGLMLLSFGIGARLRTAQITTLPELFEKVYHSVLLRRIAGFMSALSLLLILVVQGIASRRFFASIGYDEPLLLILFWSVVILYTVVGGLRAVVNTDIVQAVFLGSTLIVLFIVTLFAIPHLEILFTQNQNTTLAASDYINWLLMPMLFMIIGQDMGQRCSAAITPATVSKAMASAALLYLLLAFVPASLGIMAHQLNLPIEPGRSILLSTVMQLTNPTLTTFAACGILMAIISTANSLLCALSANLAIDVWPKASVRTAKSLTLMSGILAIGSSFFLDNVVSVMIIAYEAFIYLFFTAILMGVFLKKPPLWLCVTSILLGLLLFVAQNLTWLSVPITLGLLFIGQTGLWISHRICHD